MTDTHKTHWWWCGDDDDGDHTLQLNIIYTQHQIKTETATHNLLYLRLQH